MTQTRSSRFDIRSLVRRPEFAALLGTVAVYIFFSIFGGAEFLAIGGLSSWMNIAAELGIIALPVALVMIAGDLDLSVGSTFAASAISMAVISGYFGNPTWIGITVALLLSLLIGFINGIIVTKTNLPSFVVTLAVSFACVGLTLGLTRLITGTVSVDITPDELPKAIFGTQIDGNWETAILFWAGFAIITSWILYKTKYGNWIFAIGGDVTSAKATGIPVDKVRIALFIASAFGAGLVGVIQTSLYNSAQVAAGSSFVFNSIIAVVVGGVLLTGGYGSTLGVILGTMTFAIVNQGIYYTGWDSDWASLIIGVLLLIAVLTNNTFRRLALGGGKKKTKESN
jgi:simple sugar transport system permease protein